MHEGRGHGRIAADTLTRVDPECGAAVSSGPQRCGAAAVGPPVSVGSHARTVRLATGVLLALLASCDLAGPREAGKAVAERYFAAVAAENYDAALALYSAKLLAATPRGQFQIGRAHV